MRARTNRPNRPPLPKGFGVIWTTVAVDLVGFGIVLPIVGLYAERFGATPTTVGLIVASYSVAQFAFAPLMGMLSDRIGRKPVLIISLFGTAIGSLVTGLAGSLAFLFLGRIIDGASGASVAVARASVADIAPARDRARLFGLLGAAFGLGFVAGPAIGGLAAQVDHRLPFFVAAAIAGVNGTLAIFRLPETRVADTAVPEDGEPKATTPATATTTSATTTFRRLLVVAFISMAAFSGFETTFPLLGERRFDLTEASTGAVFAAIGIALVIVQVTLVGRTTDRLGEARVIRVGLVLNAVGLVVLAPDQGWALLVVALGLLVVGQGLSAPALSSAVAGGSAEGTTGRALGWQQSATSLGRIVGPVIAGVLFEVSIPAPYLVAALLLVAAAVLVPPTAELSGTTAPSTIITRR